MPGGERLTTGPESSTPIDKASDAGALILHLPDFDGPIDVLLDLARRQKVDLQHISILALAEQYLDFIAQAKRHNLELAADYLVMAAWLAYLKSRLLLPPEEDDAEEPDPEDMARRLALQLKRLEAMRKAADDLMQMPRHGLEFHYRSNPEGIQITRKSIFHASLYDLLNAYAGNRRKKMAQKPVKVHSARPYSLEQAFERLQRMIGGLPDWSSLVLFLPDDVKRNPKFLRSAVAATFVASLEMAKTGQVQIRQGAPFAPIWLKPPEHPVTDMEDVS